jgi:hypothetical protein
MKIVSNSDLEGGFDILPTNGRRISEKFTDYETGYLIVYEDNALDPTDNSIYCTVVDPKSGKIIDPKTRLTQIDTNEKIEIYEAGGLKLVVSRSVDLTTGMEFLHQELYDLKSGQKIMFSDGLAISDKKKDDLISKYYKREEEKREFDKFWDEEYPTYSQEGKKAFWYQYFRSAIRQQGPYGDPYSIFSREYYSEWRRHEPNIDAFLEYVIQELVTDQDQEEVRKRFDILPPSPEIH